MQSLSYFVMKRIVNKDCIDALTALSAYIIAVLYVLALTDKCITRKFAVTSRISRPLSKLSERGFLFLDNERESIMTR
jgi:hypothetical protein